MSKFAAFAPIFIVRTFALAVVTYSVHLYAIPFFDSICHSLSIRRVQCWLADPVASSAPLMPDTGVVFMASIFADRDGDFHAVPSVRFALLVATRKSTHDIRVIVFDSLIICVSGVESVFQALFL